MCARDRLGEPGLSAGGGMRVLVVTIVHHPGDARILYRQIAALRAA